MMHPNNAVRVGPQVGLSKRIGSPLFCKFQAFNESEFHRYPMGVLWGNENGAKTGLDKKLACARYSDWADLPGPLPSCAATFSQHLDRHCRPAP